MIKPVVLYGHPILTETTIEVKENNEEVQQVITDLLDTMIHIGALGLSAPQINSNLSIFVIQSKTDTETVFINPKITKRAGVERTFCGEGCMSIPKIFGDVKHFSKITIEFQDRNFVKKTKTYKVFDAVVITHEYDHLFGKLFTDYIHVGEKRTIGEINIDKLERIRKGEFDSWDKPKYDVILADGTLVAAEVKP